MIKKKFNKKWITTEKEEEKFRSSNEYWICEKLIHDKKIRNHCHITGKFRGPPHWSCNVNFKLPKIVSVIFHNLKIYDSHKIMNDIYKFDARVLVIPNGLEKYMAFTININSIFIDSLKFMNNSLEKLLKICQLVILNIYQRNSALNN